MRVLRSRASVLASFALTWQILALMFVPTALCGRKGNVSTADSEIANCPMHHAAGETCPMHEKSAADRDARGPRLGCSQTDDSFLALYGSIGVLPAAIDTPTLDRVGSAVALTSPSSNSLAPVPVAPPPRG
jgi:hypothetical protein